MGPFDTELLGTELLGTELLGTELLGIGLAKGVGLVRKVELFDESTSDWPSQREAATDGGISATGGFVSLFIVLTATSAGVSRLPWFGCSTSPCAGSSARASATERWIGGAVFGKTGFVAA
jgi:hypothetical protein